MNYMTKIIGLAEAVSPSAAAILSTFIDEQKAKLKGGATLGNKPPSLIARLWGLVILGFVGYFVIGMIEAFAQQEAADEDERANTTLLVKHKSDSRAKFPDRVERKGAAAQPKETLRSRKVLVVVLLTTFGVAHFLGGFLGHYHIASLIAQLFALAVVGAYMGWKVVSDFCGTFLLCFGVMWVPHLARIPQVAEFLETLA
uniref:Uncharacterized protein n=1 Tax=Eutreptiella gymnastica TaxID=73025 RepID=A0A7S4FHA0_9EUGL